MIRLRTRELLLKELLPFQQPYTPEESLCFVLSAWKRITLVSSADLATGAVHLEHMIYVLCDCKFSVYVLSLDASRSVTSSIL